MSEGELRDVLEGRARWAVLEGDCRAVLPSIPDGWVDHVITDPPYSRHVHASVRSSKRTELPDVGEFACRTRRAVDLQFDHLLAQTRRALALEIARVVRRWVAVFSDSESDWLWRLSLRAAGLDYVRTAAWVRTGAPQFTGDRPAVGFEAITLAHPAGRKRWNGGGKHGLYHVPIVQNRGGRTPRIHTTQKPLALMLELVEDFTDPGELVLDPFGGSGSTGIACLRLGRRVILVERDAGHAATARERLEAEERGSTLEAARAGQLGLLERLPPGPVDSLPALARELEALEELEGRARVRGAGTCQIDPDAGHGAGDGFGGSDDPEADRGWELARNARGDFEP